MKVELTRSSSWSEKPDPIAYRIIESDVPDDDYYGGYFADIESIEWAVDKWGDLVVKKSDKPGVKLCVEIYDYYRE